MIDGHKSMSLLEAQRLASSAYSLAERRDKEFEVFGKRVKKKTKKNK